MILDYQHAAVLEHRFRREHDAPTPGRDLRILCAIAGLLKHFTGNDDALADALYELASERVDMDSVADGGDPARDLLAEWDYSDSPHAAVTYLAGVLAPSQPVNRVRQ